jgi:hypothetical protein
MIDDDFLEETALRASCSAQILDVGGVLSALLVAAGGC